MVYKVTVRTGGVLREYFVVAPSSTSARMIIQQQHGEDVEIVAIKQDS